MTDLPALAPELSDGGTRLAKTLKRLDCALADATLQSETTQVKCIADMLQRNRTLEFVCVRVPYEVYKAIDANVLARFDNTLLPVAIEPLHLACRLALLSVFSPRPRVDSGIDRDAKRRVPSSEARRFAALTMDRHVLSHIFELAAATPCVEYA